MPGKGEEERAMGVFGGQWERKGKTAKEIKIPLEKASRRFREVQTEREQREDRRAGVASWAFGVGLSQWMKLDVIRSGQAVLGLDPEAGVQLATGSTGPHIHLSTTCLI